MPIAARAEDIVEGNADRCLGIAALHGQVEVDDRVAGIAGKSGNRYAKGTIPSAL
jgi:hypothetical protein